MSTTAIILKQARVSRGLSIRKLATLSGVTAAHISNIENAKVNASLDVLVKLANALHIDYNDLLFKTDDPKAIITKMIQVMDTKDVHAIMDLCAIVNETECGGKYDLNEIDSKIFKDIKGLVFDVIKNRLEYHLSENK